MGYMGLDHWGESDMACDLRYDIEDAKSDSVRSAIIEKAVKFRTTPYNTDGPVNLTLLIEDGILHKEDFSESQLDKIVEYFSDLDTEDCDDYHKNAYARLFSLVKTLRR